MACFTSQIVSSPGVMRSRAALNAFATGPLWSISSNPPAISMPSVVAVPTQIPPGSLVSVSVSNARTRPVRHHGVGDRARTHLVGHAEHGVEDAAPLDVVLDDSRSRDGLRDLGVNGIADFLDQFVEHQVLLRLGLRPDLADPPRD